MEAREKRAVYVIGLAMGFLIGVAFGAWMMEDRNPPRMEKCENPCESAEFKARWPVLCEEVDFERPL